MLTAIEVQKMIEAEDGDNILYGYTFDRHSVSIYFEDGKLVRREVDYNDNTVELLKSESFDPEYFRFGIKRFYRLSSSGDANVKLVELFKSFGNPLPLTG